MPELLNRKLWQNQLRLALARVAMIKRFHALETVDSTNHFARDLAQNRAPAGTLVIARSQSTGRGRLNRAWHSPKDLGLWFSLILRPRIDSRHLGLLGFLPAVALVEVLHQHYQLTASTKWPNDVRINRKKISGILCESQMSGNRINFAIVGVGINVYQKTDDFPISLQARATSIQESTPTPVNAIELLVSLLNHWHDLLMALESGDLGTIIERWKKHCAHLHRQIVIDCETEQIRGKFIDLSPEGAALIENERGERKLIFVGESTLVEE